MPPAWCALPDRRAEAARRHLERLAAVPRPAGSPAETAARDYCAEVLRSLGFEVSEEPFEFSTLPGRFGTPLCGAAAIAMMAAAGHVGFRGHAKGALLVLAIGGVAVLVVAWWLARFGVLELPWSRQRSVNLAAVRRAKRLPATPGGSADPDVWLVAHLDSKSQPLPIAIRALGVMLSLAVWVIALVVSVLQIAGMPLSAWWPAITVAGVLAGVPVAATVVGSRSPGALDNASGVATVLIAAEESPTDRSIGVLLTSGEELGLAGARAWALKVSAGTAINVDGVDDRGIVRVTHPRARPARLLRSISIAAHELGIKISCGRLPPGLLVDGVALADRGWKVVTLSKGEWQTVARIHTPADDLARLRGDGVAEVAALVARASAEAG
ncbi:MAG TPA: M28 family peptidase [Gemmatimonadaceae bacterium]|nr:M28 family peptidase [Gemmatimonadaceae bacterium]